MNHKIYLRNKFNIISLEGIEVDEGALWEFDPELNRLILVDEDQYLTAKPDPDLFEKES